MMDPEAFALRARYCDADFAQPDAGATALLDALETLSYGQRTAWKARYCGIVRARVGDRYVDVVGPRLGAPEAAVALGLDQDAVRHLCQRAVANLVRILATERAA